MDAYKKRKNFFNTNKYQQRIIVVAFVASMTLCLLLSIFIMFFHRDLINLVTSSSNPPTIDMINKWGALMLGSFWTFFFAIMVWALSISSSLVGAFERIIRELDNILDGKQKGPIHARANDDLANDLLERVNVLIQHLPERSGKDNYSW